MTVTKRDQLKLPKRKTPAVQLSSEVEIYLPTYHFLVNEFEHARRHELGIIRDDHEEFIHQYRVALRRSRTLISLLKPLFRRQDKEILKDCLRQLMQHTNLVRDLDVFLINMEQYFSLLEHQHHKGLTRFFDDIQSQRRKALKFLKGWLKSSEYNSTCKQVLTQLENMRNNPTVEGQLESNSTAHSFLWRQFKQIESQCHNIDANSDDTIIHQLRIDCKKFRYLLEYFTPVLPIKETKLQVAQLKILQDRLGSFNDSSVQLDFFKHYLTEQKLKSGRYKAIEELIDIYADYHLKAKQLTVEQLILFRQPNNLDLFYTLYQAPAP
ncbi:CHAD domain-containing protein [Photobacterium sp. DNB23_23_1]|uniref:CHAD domain-containing protein n=1 Tax=Photobacterium pectinilyticum TaxID=2906793 RepID=A0ABT1N7Y6_9GAMM|nr:CHAD domain-containing protein [Photobacterium sp. ZSDE20]MCQ1060662.1 CHAD domain-containing protein [Photobacterium sp. ZSDE20]MDD1828239.1 CHAD domain-containing protein [Photobacterium sp. ZSDE20]